MSEGTIFDASVLIKLYLPEIDSEEAQALVSEALLRGDRLFAPAFLPAEVLSVLRRSVKRGLVRTDQAEIGLNSLFSLPLEYVDGKEVYTRAWRLATDLGLPVLYDAVYLAVAELHGAIFWTADEAMLRVTTAARLPYVRPLLSRRGAQ